MIKFSGLLLFCIFLAASIYAQESNLPPNPFSDLNDQEEIADYSMEVDRSRGAFSIDAKDGKYQPGSHFAHWFFTANAERWGNYHVALRYSSSRPKLGIQVKIGDEGLLKGYAPRTKGGKVEPMVIGKVYLPKKGEYPVAVLTGDQSNVPSFMVDGVNFTPAPESEPLGQSIDGSVQLEAKTATTYSLNMRYEPNEKKNCLGFWTLPEDWAEWNFDISSPGKFKLEIVQGCGEGQGGSEVALLIDDQTVKFTVEDTGGFQNWKTRDLGVIELKEIGDHKLAIKPLSKAAKAVMDIQKVTLTPVE